MEIETISVKVNEPTFIHRAIVFTALRVYQKYLYYRLNQ